MLVDHSIASIAKSAIFRFLFFKQYNCFVELKTNVDQIIVELEKKTFDLRIECKFQTFNSEIYYFFLFWHCHIILL